MTEPIESTSVVYSDQNLGWGAILGGWFVATAVAILLYVLGTALGMTALSAADIENLGKKAAVGATVWLFLTWVIALYFGGLFASAANYCTEKKEGALQGIGVWALAMVLTALVGVLGSGATGFLGMNVLKDAGTSALAVGSSMPKGNSLKIPAAFQARIKQSVDQAISARSPAEMQTVRTATEQLNADALGEIGSALIHGNTEEAKNVLAARTSLSRPEIDQAVKTLSDQAGQLGAKAKEAAGKIAAYTAAALWCSFIIGIVSLAAAAAGGMAGACAGPYVPRGGVERTEV